MNTTRAKTTVDGVPIWQAPVEVGRLVVEIPLFIGFQHHPRWLFGISAINSSKGGDNLKFSFFKICQVVDLALKNSPPNPGGLTNI